MAKKERPVRHIPQRRRPLGRRLAAYKASRPERPERTPTRSQVAVPSFFTLMNLFCGFLALIQISEGRLSRAAWIVVLAGFFDVLDGLMARLTHGNSDFGVELDSLADIVSFGVAPAFLVYAYGLKQFGMLGVMIAALPAICGAVRLARFNVLSEGEKKPYFDGMPIPTLAFTIVAFILTFEDPTWFDQFSRGRLSILIPFIVVLSALMLTNIQFDSLPKFTPQAIRAHWQNFLFFSIGTLLILFLQEVGLFISAMIYIMYSIGRAITRFVLAVWRAEGTEDGMSI